MTRMPVGFLAQTLALASCVAGGASASAGELKVYPGFSSEIAGFTRIPNQKIYPLDREKRERAIRGSLEFASRMGIDISKIDIQAQGLQSSVRTNPLGDVTHFLYLESSESEDVDEDAIVVREAWGIRPERARDPKTQAQVAPALDVDDFFRRHSWLSTSRGEQRLEVHGIEGREAREDGSSQPVIRVRGFVRTIAGRQVFNSALKLEGAPDESRVSGFTLNNWWPLGEGRAARLKNSITLEDDIKRLFLAQSNHYKVAIHQCQLGYHQLSGEVIPAVNCQGVEKRPEVDAHLKVSVSLVAGKETDDERTARSDGFETESPLQDSAPSSSRMDWLDRLLVSTAHASDGGFVSSSCMPRGGGGDDGHGTFSLYFSNEEARFRTGVKEFQRKFETWSGERREAQADYFYGKGTSSRYADEADLVILSAHGTPRKVMLGHGAGVLRLNHDSTPTSCMGTSDMEYFIHSGCHGGSAVYCEGMGSLERFRATESRYSIFKGLHVFGSNHGARLSGTSNAKKISRKLARYLEDGISVREAWADSENDSNGYTRDSRLCYSVRNPERGCALKSFKCDRWDVYPGLIYIDEHRNESLRNRERHRSDPVAGDSNYRLSHLYFHDSDRPNRVPIYSPGHDLP
jgi:hypothetical protein